MSPLLQTTKKLSFNLQAFPWQRAFLSAGPHDEQNDTLHTISLDDSS